MARKAVKIKHRTAAPRIKAAPKRGRRKTVHVRGYCRGFARRFVGGKRDDLPF